MTGQYNHIGQPYQNMWLVKTDSLGCDSVTCSYLTGIEEGEKVNSLFKIYPNPNVGKFIFKMDDTKIKSKSLLITINDLLGQNVYSKNIKANLVSEINLNIEDLAKGIYIVNLYDANLLLGQTKLIIE